MAAAWMPKPKRICVDCLRWVTGHGNSIRCPICGTKHRYQLRKAKLAEAKAKGA